MTIKEMLEKRAKLVKSARDIHDKAATEKREPTAEERQQFDKLMKDAADLKTKADALTADQKRQQDLEAAEKEMATSQGRQTELERSDRGGQQGQEQQQGTTIELRKSVCGDVRTIRIEGERATQKYIETFRRFLGLGERGLAFEESRALQKDSDTGGGFLSAPMQFMAELIKNIDDDVFMRRICRVLPPVKTADGIGIPSLDNDPADPTWVSELSIGNEDTTMSFGKRELKPHPLAQLLKISKTLIRRSTMGADGIVRNRLAYKAGIVQENAFLNGSGALQPLGIFTASANGISTGRDVSTGNAATEIRFDGLKECEYTLKAGHRRKAQWVFHRDGIKQISKLKDGEGRYIWVPSVQVGQPDRILNMLVNESEYAPNTFSANQYVGILGDFSQYWIVDALTLIIQVLLELYAAANQNGYLARLETDGMPVLENAFARVKLASS